MTVSRTGLAILVGVVVVVGIAVGVWWIVRPAKSAKQQIQELFIQAERAVEDKSLSRLVRLVADDYDDGVYTKTELKRQAVAAFRQFRTIRVTPVLGDLQITGARARVQLEVDVWLEAEPAESPRHLALGVELERQKKRWLVTSAGGDWPEAEGRLHDLE